jgi:NifB/MoaA-like Fe-S oxidoreductase
LEYTEYDGGKRELALVTGVSSSSFMNEISREIQNKLNISITVYPVKNEFFGERITVTGLITGGDIIKQIKGIIKEKTLLIPTNMLKADEDIFLDDIKLSDLEKELDVSIIKCKYTGDDLIDKIVNEVL